MSRHASLHGGSLLHGEHSPLFKLASLLVRFDHVASFIVNANDGIMRTAAKPLPGKAYGQSEPDIIRLSQLATPQDTLGRLTR